MQGHVRNCCALFRQQFYIIKKFKELLCFYIFKWWDWHWQLRIFRRSICLSIIFWGRTKGFGKNFTRTIWFEFIFGLSYLTKEETGNASERLSRYCMESLNSSSSICGRNVCLLSFFAFFIVSSIDNFNRRK